MNPDNDILVSAASGWEISIKRALDKHQRSRAEIYRIPMMVN